MKKVLFPFLLAILIIQTSSLAFAQSQGEIRINQYSTIEGPDAMTLRLYFNIYDDRTGTSMLTLDAQSAQVTLLNTNYTVNGEIKKPDVPIYITLVLDSSGSMGGAAKDLQDAAKLALNNTPDNSLFSIVQFDEEIQLLQDFTENIPALQFAIDRYKVSRNGTCLYDAAYSAVEAMTKAPVGRRAVILFTDGKDENKEGKPCSKHTYQELVDFAMKSQVPISTIGLSYNQGAINSLELESLAGSTGGVSAVATQGNLAASFEKIMQALKAQWMLEATIYPRRGSNDGVFNLTLKDGTSFSTTFNINSNTDYPGPPSPVVAKFAGLQLNAAKQAYEVQLDLTSSDLVGYVKIEVWDTDGGSKVGEFVFDHPGPNNSFFIPTEKLTVGRGYQLRITAVGKDDNVPFEIARDDNGKGLTELIHEFQFDPSASYPSLQIQSLSEEKSGDLTLTVNVTNPDLIGGFDGWLVDEGTNTQVPNSNFTVSAISDTTGTITLPMRANRVPNGKYTVIVRVLAKNNNVYSTAVYEGLVYNAPSIFSRIGVALVAAPIFLLGILIVIAAVVGFLMYNSSRQKSLSGTPVLQGRLGGQVKMGKQSGPSIPVADNEPIPSRDRPKVPMGAARAASTPLPKQPTSSDATMIANDVIPESDSATVIASSPVIPLATLTVVQSPENVTPSKTVTVKTFPFVVGRTEGSLIIPDKNVSRKHVQITYNSTTNAYYLTDLNSSNGTRIDSQRVTPGQPTYLSNGAMISIGPNVVVRFEIS